jgi:periplasmic divalent cation tolerance protein
MGEPPRDVAPIALVTTVATLEDARRIGRALVERRLAACAQIAAIESFYRWEGAVQNEPEFRLLLKTTAAGRAALEAALLAMHPYQLPALHATRLDHAHPAYAAWIDDCVDGDGDGAP